MIDEYKREWLIAKKKNSKASIRTTMCRLRGFFHEQLVLISRLTPSRIETYYERRQKNADDTHMNEFGEVRTFLKWCVRKGYLKRNPAEGIEVVGRRNPGGKDQLRPREALAFLLAALDESKDGHDGSFAAVTCLLLGLRPSELIRRVVRDVDTLLWQLYIPKGKTRRSKREVSIPAILRPHFEQRLDGREPRDLLLPSSRSANGHMSYETVRKNTKRICRKLGLPEVCGYSLRGCHTTIGIGPADSSESVTNTLASLAASVGHESTATTVRHYIKGGTIERLQQERFIEALLSEVTS